MRVLPRSDVDTDLCKEQSSREGDSRIESEHCEIVV